MKEEKIKNKKKESLRLVPTLESLPSTTSALSLSFPVGSPLEEKKERRLFQVTEEAMRSTPLLMKWPLSFNVEGSSPKLRAIEPRSSLCSSQATTWTIFDSEGQYSLIVLELFPAIALSLQCFFTLSLSQTVDFLVARSFLIESVINWLWVWHSIAILVPTVSGSVSIISLKVLRWAWTIFRLGPWWIITEGLKPRPIYRIVCLTEGSRKVYIYK